MNRNTLFIILLVIIINQVGCNGQNKHDNNTGVYQQKIVTMNRKAVVSGQFYSGSKEQLWSDLEDLFQHADKNKSENVVAVISPHAGYVFSGQVAATSFNQIDTTTDYEHIFLIASSHRTAFKGASVYYLGNYETPLGEVPVDMEFAQYLINEHDVFDYHVDAHSYEHSIEVQLPFLQYIMKNKYKIIPIVIGSQSVNECKQIANALKPYFNKKNLFIISTDFSHYPEYNDACEIDSLTANAIALNNPDKLIELLNSYKVKEIENLSTGLCGWTSVLTLLYMTQGQENIEYKKILYKNSGDSKYGDHNRVVGYFSIVVELNGNIDNSFSLTEKEKKQLLKISRETLESYIINHEIPEINEIDLTKNLKQHCGAFVTIHKNGKLRGCIGRFEPGKSLYKVVQDMTIAASTKDRRFDKVSEDEVDEIEIEISVLTPLKKIESIDELELGKHGIYIKKGYTSGTFLPQVATETGWSKNEFLGHCSKDKAGLGWTGWKDADLFIYEAIIFDEKELK